MLCWTRWLMNNIIDLNKAILINKDKNSYLLNGKIIYMKGGRFSSLKELLAEEIAKYLEIDCLHYEVGTFQDRQTVFSYKFYEEDEHCIFTSNLLKDYYKNCQGNANNLIDIWLALDRYLGGGRFYQII